MPNHEITPIRSVEKLAYHLPSYLQNAGITDSKIPKSRLQLARLPTPIQEWFTYKNNRISIKRDDLTGFELSGNKSRKLEFTLAKAMDEGVQHIISCGGNQSNSCRTIAALTAKLGIDCSLVLMDNFSQGGKDDIRGNFLLHQFFGAQVYLVPKTMRFDSELPAVMREVADSSKKKSWILPAGAATSDGAFGYIHCFEELVRENELTAEDCSDIVFATGSGGTAAGLAIANYFAGNRFKIHAISISEDEKFFYGHVQDMIDELGLALKAREIVNFIDGYMSPCYGVSEKRHFELIRDVARKTGILTDPAYTGKALLGLLSELDKEENDFAGSKILFLHTGGGFGLFDGRFDTFYGEANTQYWNDVKDVV